MNVESELEEVKRLKDQMSQDNNISYRNGVKIDYRISSITEKLTKLKEINQKQMLGVCDKSIDGGSSLQQLRSLRPICSRGSNRSSMDFSQISNRPTKTSYGKRDGGLNK